MVGDKPGGQQPLDLSILLGLDRKTLKISKAVGGKGHPCALGVNRIEAQRQGSS